MQQNVARQSLWIQLGPSIELGSGMSTQWMCVERKPCNPNPCSASNMKNVLWNSKQATIYRKSTSIIIKTHRKIFITN